jgi:hypothetical protein
MINKHKYSEEVVVKMPGGEALVQPIEIEIG